MRSRFAAALAALGFAIGIASTALATQSPTLAELALKEQERRKALKASGKLLTERDLPIATPPPKPAAPPDTAKGAPPDAAAAMSTGEPGDQTLWRQRIVQVRDALRRNEIVADALQTRINALTNDFAARDDPYQRARIADDRQKVLAELDRVRSEIALQKKKIEEIEEEARRAGVPPGWLR